MNNTTDNIMIKRYNRNNSLKKNQVNKTFVNKLYLDPIESVIYKEIPKKKKGYRLKKIIQK